MTITLLAIILPLLGAVGQSAVGGPRAGAVSNAILSAAGFVLTLAVAWSGQVGELAALFGGLSGFVGLTAALANIVFVRADAARFGARRWRCYHGLFQLMLGLSLLGLYTDNIGLLWLALAGEAVATAMSISLDGTAPALAAAWADLLIGAAGTVLALFGSLLVYLAAQLVLPAGLSGMRFATLSAHAAHLNPSLLCLGFILIVFGYGARVTLMPLQRTASDHDMAGEMPLNFVLRGLFINVALLAILRFGHLVRVSAGPMLPASLLLTLSLVTLFFAVFALARSRDIRRFLAAVAAQQAAISLLAFGIGGTLAVFGGLLQMMLRTLLISGALVALAPVVVGGKDRRLSFVRLRGLLHGRAYTGWVLAITVFSLACLPPSGLFVGVFIIIKQVVLNNPWICLPFALALGLCALPILRRAAGLLPKRAPVNKPRGNQWCGHLAVLHLVLVLVLAFAMPLPLVHLLTQAAEALQ